MCQPKHILITFLFPAYQILDHELQLSKSVFRSNLKYVFLANEMLLSFINAMLQYLCNKNRQLCFGLSPRHVDQKIFKFNYFHRAWQKYCVTLGNQRNVNLPYNLISSHSHIIDLQNIFISSRRLKEN